MAKWTKRLLGAGVLAGLLYAFWRALEQRAQESPVQWKPQPFPMPPEPIPTVTAPDSADAWVEPVDGTCPTSHPVKAKLASGIFHVPGGALYDRTSPDRCYADASAAESDGLRASKR
jgi:hypothetical protein